MKISSSIVNYIERKGQEREILVEGGVNSNGHLEIIRISDMETGMEIAAELNQEEMDAARDSLYDHLDEYGWIPNRITCSMCQNECDAETAHLHQGQYIGDECCWDERLKNSE